MKNEKKFLIYNGVCETPFTLLIITTSLAQVLLLLLFMHVVKEYGKSYHKQEVFQPCIRHLTAMLLNATRINKTLMKKIQEI